MLAVGRAEKNRLVGVKRMPCRRSFGARKASCCAAHGAIEAIEGGFGVRLYRLLQDNLFTLGLLAPDRDRFCR